MERKIFLKSFIGGATVMTMDGFSTLANALVHGDHKNSNKSEFASYEAIHLNVTNLERTSEFWTKIVGMKLRKSDENRVEFGSDTKTLIVVHQTAKTRFKKGYSGLYHVAIHAPTLEDFASMINRVSTNRYPFSPIDHTMSKSIYLDDPDGINVEFTLETPERFKRVVSTGGMKIEDVDGVIRSASERLDVNEVMKALLNKDVNTIISSDTYIGHIHLYANNVERSNVFYKRLGFYQFNYLPQFMYADLGAGGEYQHRIAMNSWHGANRPLAPADSAGMRHIVINYSNRTKLQEAIANVPECIEKDGGYWVNDPTGNVLFLRDVS